jgi:8-amino-7-oxononanoate synthase
MTRWRTWAARLNDETRAAGRWRSPRSVDAFGPLGSLADGTKVVSFASNDYLGLSAHPTVLAAGRDAIDRWGTGSTAARLVVGSRPVHDELEAELAEWKHSDAAVLFPTGFMANLGVLSTVAHAGTTVLSDELNHASIIDGCRLARADVAVFRHGDAQHAASLLRSVDGPAVLVSDAVFSMDGDVAPVADLADACAQYDALLLLDEAHVVTAPVADTGDAEVARVGTLSKTLGALGGFAAADRELADLLVNRARSYIFTTASTPADAAAALAALRVVRSAQGAALVDQLRTLVERLRPGHPSPIVPVVVGDEAAAMAASRALLDRGLLVPAIRPPTVPAGSSRLRIALSAAHTVEQVDDLIDALDGCVPGWRD